ncbi:hypothetical protein GCM10027447_33410 [Glycomyces halotolerans]
MACHRTYTRRDREQRSDAQAGKPFIDRDIERQRRIDGDQGGESDRSTMPNGNAEAALGKVTQECPGIALGAHGVQHR